MIERIFPPGVVSPRGPYSPAVKAGDFVFVSGQVPVDPATNEYSYGTIEEETRRTLENIRSILAGCGAGMEHVVKCNVYLKDERDFPRMNAVYVEFFGDQRPARTTVGCRFFNQQIKVEIDCIAYLGS
ncbi:MAG: RidA family protein [Bryobacter sp.]|nr:RidA family protein [Bryobacter sp.]